MKQKQRLIVYVSLAAILIAAALTYLLNSKFHFLADSTQSNSCKSEHSYIIKTGRQGKMNGTVFQAMPELPGLPKNHLFTISKEETTREFGKKLDKHAIVCELQSGGLAQIPSYIDESGEVWFQAGDNIPQNTTKEYYISEISDISQRLELVRSSDVEIHPFASDSDFSKDTDEATTSYWRKTEWFGGQSVLNYSVNTEASPGGNDSLKITQADRDPYITSPGWNSRLLTKPFSYAPSGREGITPINGELEGTYYIFAGWIKYEDMSVQRINDFGGAVDPNTFPAEAVAYQNRNGAWDYLTSGNRLLVMNQNGSTDWDRFLHKVKLGRDSISFAFDGRSGNSLRAGKMSYSSFKVIKNIKAPADIESWSDNSSKYFQNDLGSIKEAVSYDGSQFALDGSTKLYLTNNFPEYYKDHYDNQQPIVIKKLAEIIKARTNSDIAPLEIKDFQKGKAIILGDIANAEFKSFFEKLRPDSVGLDYQTDGYRIFVGETYIAAVGINQTGSYYAALRLADLFSSGSNISQRMESDWSDSSFRSVETWQFTQYINESSPADIQRVKDDIKKMSELKNNFYLINGPFEYNTISQTAQKNMLLDLYAYSKAYYIEPVASSFSFRNTRMPNQYKNYMWQERNYTVSASSKSARVAVDLTRKYINDPKTDGWPEANIPNIPIIVKNDVGDITYQEGVDYNIEQKSDGYYINILEQSTMAATGSPSQYKLKITSNAIPYPDQIPDRVSIPAVRQISKTGIKNAIELLHPKYIHINSDEVYGVAADYRDIFNPDGSPTGVNPSVLWAQVVNELYTYAKGLDPNVQIIMWDDTINPYHNVTGWAYLTPKPYTFAAVDMIPKDIIIDEWSLQSGKSANCQQFLISSKFHLNKGFRIIAGPTVSSDYDTFNCINQLRQEYPEKVMGYNIPQWQEVYEDKPKAPLVSSWAWNINKVNRTQSSENPLWHDDVGDSDDSNPKSNIERLNVSNGQRIKSNPYMLSIKVKDPSRVAKVEYFVDDVLIGTATLPDINGVFDWPWDTSKYHSTIRMVIYDNDGTTEEVSRETVVDLAAEANTRNVQIRKRLPAIVLPKTGFDE